MSTAPPPQGIPVQFIYMCEHQVSAYFRRIDGRPLSVYTMKGPYETGVVGEELDLEADPQVSPVIIPLLRICCLCRRFRRVHIQTMREYYYQHPEDAHLQQSRLEEFRMRNSETDLRLMERALGHDILRVQERVERRLIEQTPTVDNNNSHNIQDKPQEQSWGATLMSNPKKSRKSFRSTWPSFFIR